MFDTQTNDVLEDFDLLVKEGVIGCYNSCEVTEIFWCREEQVYNLYTLICFEHSFVEKGNLKFLTPNRIKMPNGKGILGIRQGRIAIDEARDILFKLSEQGKLEIENGNPSSIGKLMLQRKCYISPDDESDLNRILKNNFFNGSYIIEAFDCEKKNIREMMEVPPLLNQLSEIVHKFLPLELASMSDRIGNVIFQFPINILKIQPDSKQERGIHLKVDYHPYYKGNKIHLSCIAEAIGEQGVFDFVRVLENIDEHLYYIPINTSNTIQILVWNEIYNLILYKRKMDYIRGVELDFDIASPQNRVFKLRNEIIEIPVSFNEKKKQRIRERLKEPVDWSASRKYERQRSILEKNRKFRQFNEGQRDEAMENIRELIKRNARHGAYLWDPYASTEDIKETLYHVPYINVPLRVITALKNTDSNGVKKQKEIMRESFNEDDFSYLYMNIEVRAQCCGHGEEFHDRFIIFPGEKPRVWSLGASINNQGKTHHIVMEVQNAQHICDAFEELWKRLDFEECIIWKKQTIS